MEPQIFQELREWMQHCVAACDEGEDFNVTRDQLLAFTTLGLMEKAGRGKWRPTEAGRALAEFSGVALVPVEPTERMVVEGFEAAGEFRDSEEFQEMSGCRGAAETARVTWKAMLHAASLNRVTP